MQLYLQSRCMPIAVALPSEYMLQGTHLCVAQSGTYKYLVCDLFTLHASTTTSSFNNGRLSAHSMHLHVSVSCLDYGSSSKSTHTHTVTVSGACLTPPSNPARLAPKPKPPSLLRVACPYPEISQAAARASMLLTFRTRHNGCSALLSANQPWQPHDFPNTSAAVDVTNCHVREYRRRLLPTVTWEDPCHAAHNPADAHAAS